MAAVLRSPYVGTFLQELRPAARKQSEQLLLEDTFGCRDVLILYYKIILVHVYINYIDILQYCSVSIKTMLLAEQWRNWFSISDIKTVHMVLRPIQLSTEWVP